MILSILRIPTMIINILFKNRKRKVFKNLEHELLFIPAMLSWGSTDNIRLNCFDIQQHIIYGKCSKILNTFLCNQINNLLSRLEFTKYLTE